MTFAYPNTLETMNIDVIGVYVSDFMERLITDPSYESNPDGTYRHYQEPCRRLQEYFEEHMPKNMTNDVITKIMKHINITYKKLMENEIFQRACTEIAPLVLKSVIQKVKKIDCIRDTWHPTLLDHYKIPDCDLIYRTLPLLEDLEELKLGRMDTIKNVSMEVGGFRETLVKFSCRNFWEKDIETLTENCPLIRSLDIGGTAYYSAKIFTYIHKFKHLEKLNLSLLGDVARKELHFTVNWLAGVVCFGDSPETDILPKQLKFFGCVNPDKQLIPTIANFSNLNSLTLSFLQSGSLAPLTNLKQLRNLTFIESRFSLVEDFLNVSGNQIKCLNIINCSGTELRFISQKCRSLECFHLQFRFIEYLVFPLRLKSEPVHKPPEFPNVVKLQLLLPDPDSVLYVLKCVPHVKKVSLLSNFEKKFMLREIIEPNLLLRLEEFHLRNDIVVEITDNVSTVYEFNTDGSTSVIHTTP